MADSLRYEAESLVESSLDSELEEFLRFVVCSTSDLVDDVLELDCLRVAVAIAGSLAMFCCLNALSIILKII